MVKHKVYHTKAKKSNGYSSNGHKNSKYISESGYVPEMTPGVPAENVVESVAEQPIGVVDDDDDADDDDEGAIEVGADDTPGYVEGGETEYETGEPTQVVNEGQTEIENGEPDEYVYAYGHSHSDTSQFSKPVAVALEQGTAKHPVDVRGNALGVNLTAALLGREDVMARVGGVKVKLLKDHGPLIEIQGLPLLGSLLGSSSSKHSRNYGTAYIVNNNNNRYAEAIPTETIGTTVEPTETIGTNVEPTETYGTTVEPTETYGTIGTTVEPAESDETLDIAEPTEEVGPTETDTIGTVDEPTQTINTVEPETETINEVEPVETSHKSNNGLLGGLLGNLIQVN